jgi:hypothetical protein
MRGKEPIVWDFGSAAVHHRLYCDWLVPQNVKAGMLGMRGTVPPAAGLMQRHAEDRVFASRRRCRENVGRRRPRRDRNVL